MGSDDFQYHREERRRARKNYSTDKLNSIAAGQKLLICAIAVYLVVIFSQIFLRGSLPLAFWFIILGAAIMANVVVLITAARIYGGAIALLFSVLSFLPLAGLLILLLVNSKATRLLKDKGYEVGLLGAKPK